jgi:hypothetical protein
MQQGGSFNVSLVSSGTREKLLVILSDREFQSNREQILRFAQDDNVFVLRCGTLRSFASAREKSLSSESS